MGANSSYGMTEKGHMFFVRDNVQAGAGTRISTEFQTLVLLQMVERARESEPLNHGGTWRRGQPVPDELTAVWWQDAEMGQNKAALIDGRQDSWREQLKITVNMHGANTTNMRQWCDTVPLYMEWSQKVKKIKPHVDEQLRCLVYNRLRAVPELHLPEQTLQVVASFASAYPAVKAQAMTHHKVAPVLEKSGARACARALFACA